MTRLNQALLAAASSVALFGGALALVTSEAKAQYTAMKYADASRMCKGQIYTHGIGSRSTYVCTENGQRAWTAPAADR